MLVQLYVSFAKHFFDNDILILAIEHVWSAAKRHCEKLLLSNEEKLTRESHRDTVRQALKSIPPTAIRNLINANRKYITQML